MKFSIFRFFCLFCILNSKTMYVNNAHVILKVLIRWVDNISGVVLLFNFQKIRLSLSSSKRRANFHILDKISFSFVHAWLMLYLPNIQLLYTLIKIWLLVRTTFWANFLNWILNSNKAGNTFSIFQLKISFASYF